MSDPISVAAAVASIPSIITSCVDCFNYIQNARHIGRDVQTNLLLLSDLELRLTRWYESLQTNGVLLFHSVAEENFARQILKQILLLVDGAEVKIRNYDSRTAEQSDGLPETGQGSAPSILDEGYNEQALDMLQRRMSQISNGRKRAVGFWKKTAYAVYDKQVLEKLVQDIGALLGALYQNFPPPEAQHKELVKFEVEEISNENDPTLHGNSYTGGTALMEILRRVDARVDEMMTENPRPLPKSRHYIGDQQITGGLVHDGDVLGPNYNEPIARGGGVGIGKQTVSGGKVHNGDNYTGKSIFEM